MLHRLFIFALVLLVISAQTDDYWAVAPCSPVAVGGVDDDDEYLPVKAVRAQENASKHQSPSFLGLHLLPSDFDLLPGGAEPSTARGADLFSPPILYVFMSLQC